MAGSAFIKMMISARDAKRHEIAQAIGVSRQTIYDILKKDDARLSEITAIADALDFDIQITITDRHTGQQIKADIPPPAPINKQD